MRVAKALALLLTVAIGYGIGMVWVGPWAVGLGRPSTAAPASTQGVTVRAAPAPVAPAATPSEGDDGPVAVVSERRHREDAVSPDSAVSGAPGDTTDLTTPIEPRHRRRRVRHQPAVTPDNADAAAAGDQTPSPEDTAKVGGADNEAAGSDRTDSGSPGVDATPSGNSSTSTDTGTGQPDSNSSAGDSQPRHTRRHKRAAPPPANPGDNTGDNTPAPGDSTPQAGDNSTPGDHNGDHATSSELVPRHWSAAQLLQPRRLVG